MSLSTVNKLGERIGGLSKSQEVIQQNISPDDSLGLTDIPFSETLNLKGDVTVYKRRMTGVYIVGNPTYGFIGSTDNDIVTIPVTMPLEQTSGAAYPIGPFCILDHPEWAFLDDCLLGDRDIDQFERTLLYSATL